MFWELPGITEPMPGTIVKQPICKRVCPPVAVLVSVLAAAGGFVRTPPTEAEEDAHMFCLFTYELHVGVLVLDY